MQGKVTSTGIAKPGAILYQFTNFETHFWTHDTWPPVI